MKLQPSWQLKWQPKWKDRSSSFVSARYNKIAPIYPVFEWIFALPSGIRRKTVDAMKLKKGDTGLEVGCGTGRNLTYLVNAVGSEGKIYGIDVSENMLKRARDLAVGNKWNNVELIRTDAAEFAIPEKLNGALFSLSYATMLNRNEVLTNIWNMMLPGGRITIMDAQFPHGRFGKLIAPIKPAITLFLKSSVLGNPYIKPVEELSQVTGFMPEVEELSIGSYFIASAVKD